MEKFVLILALCSPGAWAQKKILIEDSTLQVPEESNQSYTAGEFGELRQMRSKRRVGVGLNAAGSSGVAGLMVELNYSPLGGAIVGFGGGPRYSTLTMAWKYTFGGTNLAPYITAGYSRWYNESNKSRELQSSTPAFFAAKFLTEEERNSGQFGKDLLVSGLGLQYYQLYGPSLGVSFYAQIDFLVNMATFANAPTGAIGILYYF